MVSAKEAGRVWLFCKGRGLRRMGLWDVAVEGGLAGFLGWRRDLDTVLVLVVVVAAALDRSWLASENGLFDDEKRGFGGGSVDFAFRLVGVLAARTFRSS